MATAVLLRSHDPLTHLSAIQSRPPPPPPATKPPRRNRKPRSLPKSSGRKAKENAVVVKAPSPSRKLVMEEVTILKRGESNSSFPEARDDVPTFFSTNRIGPDPEILPKKVGMWAYAGPGFIASSPSPSSLPFPALFLKKEVHGDEAVATKNLRCLLGIDVLP